MKLFGRIAAAALLIAALLLSGCGGNTKKDATGKYKLNDRGEAVLDGENLKPAGKTADNNRVFYEIFVGSFSDSDGDGTGDLRGIINRMDYLNDGDDNSGTSLGVEGIWLTPIFKSPSYHKYDVTDYYTVDPAFGTTDDLKELIALCHERNVKIILDLPINHTGSLNAWFGAFTKAHRTSDFENEYYNYYCFYSSGETVPAGRTYSQLSGTNDYYECNFAGSMPELDFDNENVRQATLDIAKYYLDLGIDGFRFDAAKYIYFGDHPRCVEFWKWYIGELRKIKSDVYTVAEVWDGDGITDMYYPALNCFNFTISQTSGLIAETAKFGNVNSYTKYVQSYLDKIGTLRDDAMMLPFIANHDTDRAAGFLTAASGQMQMAANLYLLSPGSPFIYYGEELGMRGSRGGANTDANRRLAMVWGDDDKVKDPSGSTYKNALGEKETAIDQIADGASLYTYYKELLMIRKAYPEIARGDYKALSFSAGKAGGFVSTLDGKAVCVLHNSTPSQAQIDLSEVAKQSGVTFSELCVYIGAEEASLDGTTLTLGAQTSAVLR